MDEDEDVYPYPSASPSSTGRISVTVAATPPQNTLTLALPIQPKTTGGGGGREDCWSEGATEVLIDAWGERYVQLSRGNLKQQHWQDVADIVSSRDDYRKTPKTDVQCKNRIDTVKKKYKAERAKIDTHGGSSRWRFYERMDELIGSTVKSGGDKGDKIPMGVPVGFRSGLGPQKPNLRAGKRAKVEFSDEESEPENSGDSSDGLPPLSYKRPRLGKEGIPVNLKQGMARCNTRSDENRGNSMRELSTSILKFVEAYEQLETEKLQQMADMEKRRMEFAKEMELQRMQSFTKMQVELSKQLKDWRPESPENNGNNEIIDNDNNNNGVDKNDNDNSDSSS